MDYRIKQIPEDFMVREAFDPPLGSGRFSYYLLKKKGWTTQGAINRVAWAFRKRSRFINFSGNKDKQAVTEQHISILHGPARSLELDNGEIILEYLGRGRERINLGASPANEFDITVRDLPPDFRPRSIRQVPNYFDEQRFGMNLNNHMVGRLMILRRFDEACGLVPETREWLEKSPRDYVGALRSLQKRVLRIYAHAYQSWIWNRTASMILEKSPHRVVEWGLGELIMPEGSVRNRAVPIVGYDTEIPAGLAGVIKRIMKEEGIDQSGFRMKQFHEFDLAGDTRDLMAKPMGLDVGPPEDDDLNPGRKKCRVRFSLQKGSYATMVIRAIFS
jgi:tRNA pseudouridine13 synthase